MKPKVKIFTIFVVILILSFTACDKIPDGVVEPELSSIIVSKITAPESYSSTATDSVITVSLKFDNIESLAETWCAVKVVNNTKNIYDKISLLDNGDAANGDLVKGDNIYSAKVVLGKKLASGNYLINFYIKDKLKADGENVFLIGTHKINFSSGTANNPPVISNLVMPQSVNRDENFIINLSVSDPEGLQNIAQVEFTLYDPTGAYVNVFPLFDDGDFTNNGDEKAGDGIYSSKRSFKTGVMTGKWKFSFIAKDKGGLSSNTISHDLTLN